MKKLLTILLLSAFAVGCASTDKMSDSSDGMMMDDGKMDSMGGGAMKHDEMKMDGGMKESMSKDSMM